MTMHDKNTLPQRKHPVHMPPIERHNQPVILFVTIGVHPRGNHLANVLFHTAFCEACVDADTWSVGKYMLMPDHIHLFCAPAVFPRVRVTRWVQYLKERITKRLVVTREKTGERTCGELPIHTGGRGCAEPPSRLWKWHPGCWDIQIRNGEHYREKWLYVQQNPVRAELVDKSDEWPFQGEINVLRW